MGGCVGMYDEALDICHIGKEGEYLQGVYKLPCSLLSAFDFESEDARSTVREISRVEIVRRV